MGLGEDDPFGDWEDNGSWPWGCDLEGKKILIKEMQIKLCKIRDFMGLEVIDLKIKIRISQIKLSIFKLFGHFTLKFEVERQE